jgi:hypothetical protein
MAVIEITNQKPCDRCNGTGRFKRYGKCFNCDGTGRIAPPAQRAAVFATGHAEDIAAIRAGAASNAFCADLLAKLEQYGSLSPRQLEAGVKAAQRVQADRATSNSRHLGTVGQRCEFTLTTVRQILLPPKGIYNEPDRYVFLCNTPEGDRVVYFGAAECMPRGEETLRVRATVKDHTERDGVKQTLINRPKALPSPVSAPVEAVPEVAGDVQ